MPFNDYIFEQDASTVGLWRMNGDATDETGNHDLTVTGGASSVDGVAGNAYSFSNITSDRLYRSESEFRGSDSLGSIEVWVKFDSLSAQAFFCSSDVAGNNKTIRYGILQTSGTWRNSLQFYDNPKNNIIYGTVSLQIDFWNYLVVTSNGSTWKLYTNGELDTIAVTTGSNNGDWFADMTGRDNINVSGFYNNAGQQQGLVGSTDEIRISNIERTAQEIKENWYRGINNNLLYGQS